MRVGGVRDRRFDRRAHDRVTRVTRTIFQKLLKVVLSRVVQDDIFARMASKRIQPAVSERSLIEAQDRFIDSWGQMASAWGISRTMGEVHALLFILGRELSADEVMDRLSISRGNASMSLRSLVEWGVVRRVHKRGERKEYFEAEQDVWTLAKQVIRERIRREILPLLTTLHEIRDLTEQGDVMGEAAGDGEAVSPEQVESHRRRLDELLEMLQTADKLAERFVGPESRGLRLAASVLAKVP